ncbi:MAG: DUF3445 domain-containing protein [Actinomycetota bacterium]|nr:DUF3445 domain-containing protein [Actinomycetota bacterium]
MRGTGPDLPAARAPFPVTSPYRVVPAPRPLGDEPHVIVDAAYPAALRRRMQRLDSDRAGVQVRDLPERDDAGLAAALRASWNLLPWPRNGSTVALPLLGAEVDLDTATARSIGPSDFPDATDELLRHQGLDLLVTGWQLACSDDLVVLRREGPGRLRAELLAVAFPSGWPPRRRAGAGLLDLHRPVADGERLQRAAPALSEALLTKGPYVQFVWGLDPDGRLDRDPSAPDHPGTRVTPPARDWWLRVERQTTMPLPRWGRASFVIRPFLTPVTELTTTQRRTLGDAIASMSPPALAYKGIEDVRDELVDWLQFSPGSAG